MNKTVDNYFTEGCGRCPLGATPECKVHTWSKELEMLRSIVLECDLTETCKWGVPCYTYEGKNVLLVSAFNDYCSISFFKGSLLQDADQLLVKPGENSQASRLFKFTDIDQIRAVEEKIKAYIFEAIEVEKAGLKVAFKNTRNLFPKNWSKSFLKIRPLKLHLKH